MRRTAHQQRVDEFMRKAGQDVPDVPVEPSNEVKILRAKLILEEALETIKGLGVTVSFDGYPPDGHDVTYKVDGPFNLVEVVDGCCDVKVVTTGTLSACGVADMDVQAMIDESNLAKFGSGGYKREDGKWIKPPDWEAPDILSVLIQQGWNPPAPPKNQEQSSGLRALVIVHSLRDAYEHFKQSTEAIICVKPANDGRGGYQHQCSTFEEASKWFFED